MREEHGTIQVNAWYMVQENSVNIPASILLPASYNAADPLWAGNYGRVGAVIGHELAHAFDRNCSAWGLAYQREPLFGNDTDSGFHSVYPCLIAQFSAFCPLAGTDYSVQCVNGTKTADENWADAVGVRLAYDAYKRKLNKSGKSIDDAAVPGEPTYAQQFFTELARDWCTKDSEAGMSHHLQSTDVHAPNKYRVLAMLQNFAEFPSAFGCPPTPARRCQLWGGSKASAKVG